MAETARDRVDRLARALFTPDSDCSHKEEEGLSDVAHVTSQLIHRSPEVDMSLSNEPRSCLQVDWSESEQNGVSHDPEVRDHLSMHSAYWFRAEQDQATERDAHTQSHFAHAHESETPMRPNSSQPVDLSVPAEENKVTASAQEGSDSTPSPAENDQKTKITDIARPIPKHSTAESGLPYHRHVTADVMDGSLGADVTETGTSGLKRKFSDVDTTLPQIFTRSNQLSSHETSPVAKATSHQTAYWPQAAPSVPITSTSGPSQTSPEQRTVLERTFATEQYPNKALITHLSQTLGLTPRFIQGWFDRARKKWRVRFANWVMEQYPALVTAFNTHESGPSVTKTVKRAPVIPSQTSHQLQTSQTTLAPQTLHASQILHASQTLHESQQQYQYPGADYLQGYNYQQQANQWESSKVGHPMQDSSWWTKMWVASHAAKVDQGQRSTTGYH